MSIKRKAMRKTITGRIQELLEEFPENEMTAREVYEWLLKEKKLYNTTTLESINGALRCLVKRNRIATTDKARYAAKLNSVPAGE